MLISSSFPSQYLKATDIPVGQQASVTIDRIEMEDVGGKNDPADLKPVLYFVDKQKGLVLNMTNSNTIAKLFGDETNDWQEKTVMLFQTQTDFRGSMVPCLRVMAPPAPPERDGVPAAQTQRANKAAPAGDIPF